MDATVRREAGRKARETALARWEAVVDPLGNLDPVVRRAHAEAAYKEHMSRLADKSGRVRRARARARADAAERERLAAMQAACRHVWPEPGAACVYCDLQDAS